MVTLSRRDLLTGLVLLPSVALGDDATDLSWSDLLPEGTQVIPNDLLGLIDHDGPPLVNQQPVSSGVRPEWDGVRVRLPGFIVPLDHQGTAVTAFLLVPFVGACVHVPPPPANQLVFVTTKRPFESGGIFDPVKVSGMLGISSISTHLADVGYALEADRIEPFQL